MKITVLSTVFLFTLFASAWGDQSERYRTGGLGKIQTCRGIGLEACGYEEVKIPTLINTAEWGWSGLYHEKKSKYVMCYVQLERGIWTKKMLMFRCSPVD